MVYHLLRFMLFLKFTVILINWNSRPIMLNQRSKCPEIPPINLRMQKGFISEKKSLFKPNLYTKAI